MNGKDLKMERRMFLKGVGVVAAGMLAGCGSKPTTTKKPPKPPKTDKKVEDAAGKAADATKKAADTAADATKKAADTAADATKKAAEAVPAAPAK
jgi:hypothetical protein